jgi:hypothetical protein
LSRPVRASEPTRSGHPTANVRSRCG